MVTIIPELIQQHAEILEQTAETIAATAAALRKLAAYLIYVDREQKTAPGPTVRRPD